MYLVQCRGCSTVATVDCTCPPEYASLPVHAGTCALTDLGAAVTCPPGSGCCDGSSHPGASHDTAASACPGGHSDCPEPDSCPAWASATADTRHPAYDGKAPGPCPGGHCHKDIPGCAVCRPVTITFLGPTVLKGVS